MRSVWRTVPRDLLVIAASIWAIGASYGAAAHSIGLAWWQILLMASAVLAGSSEFVLISVVAGGGLPIVGALAGLLVNARNISYGLSAGRYLPGGIRGLALAHFVNDETAVYAAPHRDIRSARTAFVICGIGVAISWPLGALTGSLIGQIISPETLGLDAAFPALLFALAVPALRDRETRWAALFGGGVAVATAGFITAGLPVVLALLGVPLGWVVTRRRTSDAAEPSDRELATR
ncbi:branched-chain amino acid ABC transporter permease [Gordonia sp. TBRC 11910]|uniref:Branched-chain amino acid ABC transporter permease n=1 Tax=Gordonia asplenii TaxID=2725283 RepID=A0A848KVX4_9ACTN|nr:AzlC family ABC transporter permease [Gordonia asplenii]NMO00603.1 branched-chain amino acid ABC transporter permease [Gordonia asplenii]